MSVRVRVPTLLRRLSGGQAEVLVEASTLAEVIGGLEERFPGFRERLYDDAGRLRRHLNFYVNGEDMRFLQGLSTPIKPGDEVSIIPAASGGS